jgi:hypothetical protein
VQRLSAILQATYQRPCLSASICRANFSEEYESATIGGRV